MATCKECLHYCVCKAVAGTGKFALDTERTDQSERCPNFTDRSRFIELPCKVGDVVWVIVDKIDTPLEAKVRTVHIQNSTIALDLNVRGYLPVIKTEDKLGESIFHTKEEAEAALARKREEKV